MCYESWSRAQVHVNYHLDGYKMKLNFGHEIKYNF